MRIVKWLTSLFTKPDCVYIVMKKNSDVIYGCFYSEKQAEKYADGATVYKQYVYK